MRPAAGHAAASLTTRTVPKLVCPRRLKLMGRPMHRPAHPISCTDPRSYRCPPAAPPGLPPAPGDPAPVAGPPAGRIAPGCRPEAMPLPPAGGAVPDAPDPPGREAAPTPLPDAAPEPGSLACAAPSLPGAAGPLAGSAPAGCAARSLGAAVLVGSSAVVTPTLAFPAVRAGASVPSSSDACAQCSRCRPWGRPSRSQISYARSLIFDSLSDAIPVPFLLRPRLVPRGSVRLFDTPPLRLSCSAPQSRTAPT